jgi:hypothetical protein
MKNQISNIDLDSVRSSKYDSNIERLGDHSDSCFVCGKRTAQKHYVHYTEDGNLINTEESVSNSQGMFPIGPECSKKLPKGFTFSI